LDRGVISWRRPPRVGPVRSAAGDILPTTDAEWSAGLPVVAPFGGDPHTVMVAHLAQWHGVSDGSGSTWSLLELLCLHDSDHELAPCRPHRHEGNAP
jgi:hypothetical protein